MILEDHTKIIGELHFQTKVQETVSVEGSIPALCISLDASIWPSFSNKSGLCASKNAVPIGSVNLKVDNGLNTKPATSSVIKFLFNMKSSVEGRILDEFCII